MDRLSLPVTNIMGSGCGCNCARTFFHPRVMQDDRVLTVASGSCLVSLPFDSSDWTGMERISDYENLVDVAVSGESLLFLAEGLLHIANVRTPRIPKSIIPVSGSPERMVVHSNHAYFFDPESGLEVINVADSSNPRLVGQYPMVGVRDFAFVGSRLYLAQDSGLLIMDIGDPSQASTLGRF